MRSLVEPPESTTVGPDRRSEWHSLQRERERERERGSVCENQCRVSLSLFQACTYATSAPTET